MLKAFDYTLVSQLTNKLSVLLMQVCNHKAWCAFARPAVIAAVCVYAFACLAPANTPKKADVARVERHAAMHSLVTGLRFVWFLAKLAYLSWVLLQAWLARNYSHEQNVMFYEAVFLLTLAVKFDEMVRNWHTHMWTVVPVADLWLWIDVLFCAFREQSVVLQLLACGSITFAALDVYQFGRIVSEYKKIQSHPSIANDKKEK